MKKFMRHSMYFTAALSLMFVGRAALADGTRFSDFTPLTSSAGPVSGIGEATPITFGNPRFAQQSIAARAVQLATFVPNSGTGT